jgi:hypothetical protein
MHTHAKPSPPYHGAHPLRSLARKHANLKAVFITYDSAQKGVRFVRPRELQATANCVLSDRHKLAERYALLTKLLSHPENPIAGITTLRLCMNQRSTIFESFSGCERGDCLGPPRKKLISGFWRNAMRQMLTGFLFFVCSFAAVTVPVRPAMALVSAYVLFDMEKQEDAGRLMIGLMNCKQLIESRLPGPVVVHLACNDLPSLNGAIMALSEVEGVKRTMVWIIDQGDEE